MALAAIAILLPTQAKDIIGIIRGRP